MIVAKNFVRDDRTELVSQVFDKFIMSQELHLPFERIELNIRDTTVSVVEDQSALVCIDYNDPVVIEKDKKGVKMLVYRELFRLMFKFDIPRPIEDVIIDRELIKRGFGEDLFYLYYVGMMNKKHATLEDYINLNIPWISFSRHDKHNSDFMKRLAKKLADSRPECQKLFNLLLNVPQKDVEKAVKEYERLMRV